MAKDISTNKLKAILLLLEGAKGKDVAEAVGVTPQTISEWKAEPHFEATLNALKWEVTLAVIDKIRASGKQAAELLLDIAHNSENDETRRKACMNILELMGINNPQGGGLGLGIGSTDAKEIEKKDGLNDLQYKQELDREYERLMAKIKAKK